MTFLEEFGWRGLISDMTSELENLVTTDKTTGYIGFDPSASSLHVGSLLPIMNLARLQKAGHIPIAVVGGGTGLIGDPSGKTGERPLLSPEQLEANLEGIRGQLAQFLDFKCAHPALLVNNADWLTPLRLIDFMRDIGKYFTVNSMIAKESIRRRLESQDGVSFTEFSYMLLQAYDFLLLYDRFGCTLQMGGSDQWGNIVMGIELIRRLRGVRAYGLVSPLVLSASGTKFGKTEAGTVWLDPEKTSPYKYYQFWLNTDDRDVITYLKYFTWLSQQDIEALESELSNAAEKRIAQKTLAREVTKLTHGDDALQRAERASTFLFGGSVEGVTAAEVSEVIGDAPASEIQTSVFAGEGIALADLLQQVGLASSKSDARRTTQGGGVYLNNKRVADPAYSVTLGDSIGGELILLRKGKKHYHLVRILKG